MTASTVRRNGPYAPLGANYADNDAISVLDMDEDDRAELLYIRALAYCARDLRTEGFVSDIALRAGKVLRRRKLDTLTAAAERLVALGLWKREETGYRITSWLKWNKSWAEVSRSRQHDSERKKPGTTRESDSLPNGIQTESERNPDGQAPESERTPAGIQTPKHFTALHVTTEHDTNPSPSPLRDDDDPDGFAAFWDEYPRRVGKKDAIKAYRKALKTTDAATILAGAVAYSQDPNREDEFTAHPATWLNRGGWEDDPLPARGLRAVPSRVSEQDETLRRWHDQAVAGQMPELGA